ncbi:MAG TPA: hypothetical protein VKD91_18480, partial [Pyrinomonadaceae bacterium]|nr:hypothetical protein [Pyrinomonadaceae bacterium]
CSEALAPSSQIATKAAQALENFQPPVKFSRPMGAQWTDFGGFYFLLTLMARLRFAEFFENHPRLIELDFPQRLLLFAAEQLRIPASDPVRALFQDVSELPAQRLEFAVPPIWYAQVYRSGALVLSPVTGRPSHYLMTDRSGRSVLAIRQGEIAKSTHELIAGSRTKVVKARHCRDDLAELSASWYRAMRRWCRGYAGLRLRDLIRRRGRMAITQTHLDLFFDLDSVDIRIRRAGLDVDPGWLPWLGSVVSFHYLEKEELDGCE